MTKQSAKRILSIQSHVTSGYVGNKAAVFPLQLLGYDVDILNSCLLSNHTGYKYGAPGIRLQAEDLLQVVNGMKKNGLLKSITHLLTGYIGTTTCLEAIAQTFQILNDEEQNQFIYLCDPVLGDNGQLYVPKELIQIYIDKVIHLATVLTPNAFELSLLTNMPVTSEESAFVACDLLHTKHQIPTIVVTGTRFQPESKTLSVLVSSIINDQKIRFAIETEYIDGTFTGTGDLLSALILAWTDEQTEDPSEPYQKAVATVSAVLRRTVNEPKSEGDCPYPELRLIRSQQEILNPPVSLASVRWLQKGSTQLNNL